MAVSYRKSFLGVVGLTCVVLVLGLLVINRTHSYDKLGQSVGNGSNVFPGFKLDTTIASVPRARMKLTSGDEADPVRSGGTSASVPRVVSTSGDEADPVLSGGTSNSTSSTPATASEAKLATMHTGAGGNNSGELSHLSSPVIEHDGRSTESDDSYLGFQSIRKRTRGFHIWKYLISCAAVPGSFLRVPGSNAQSYFAALLLEIALPNSSHV